MLFQGLLDIDNKVLIKQIMKNLTEQIQLTLEFYNTGNLLKAEKTAKKLILENPNIVFLYNLIGLILASQKKN